MKPIQLFLAVIALLVTTVMACDPPTPQSHIYTSDVTCVDTEDGNEDCDDYCDKLGDEWDEGYCNNDGKWHFALDSILYGF